MPLLTAHPGFPVCALSEAVSAGRRDGVLSSLFPPLPYPSCLFDGSFLPHRVQRAMQEPLESKAFLDPR